MCNCYTYSIYFWSSDVIYILAIFDRSRTDNIRIHFYCFVKDADPLETAKVRMIEAVKINNRRVTNILKVKTVREIAPYTWQVVVDAKIQ